MNSEGTVKINTDKIPAKNAVLLALSVITVSGCAYTAGKSEKLSLLFFSLFSLLAFSIIFINMVERIPGLFLKERLDYLEEKEKNLTMLAQYGAPYESFKPLLISEYEFLRLRALREKEIEFAEGLQKRIEELKN